MSSKTQRKDSNESINSMSNYSINNRNYSVDSRSYSIDSTHSGDIEINDKLSIKIKSPDRRKCEEPIISSSPQISDVLKLMEKTKFNNNFINKCE